MTEKLTLEIAMKYPSGVIVNEKKEWLVVREYLNLYPHNRFDLSQCKLQLRPLSSLTEEEKMILGGSGYGYLKEYYFYYDARVNLSNISSKVQDKLREWNIDFESPSLQERGIAEYL